MKAGEIVGLYTGVISVRGNGQNTDYMWTYPTRVGISFWQDQNQDDVCIDGRRLGNYLRVLHLIVVHQCRQGLMAA
jgi:hypothetical protein